MKGRCYTYYPVPSEDKASKELEMTLGVDMVLYSHVPAEINRSSVSKAHDLFVRSFQI